MLKFLIIIVLVFYLIIRVGGFFFKILFNAAQQENRQTQGRYESRKTRTAPNSNVKVDYVPDKDRKEDKNFNGGQYVDFEEVK